MESSILANFKKINVTVKESSFGVTAVSTKVAGSMAFKQVSASILTSKECEGKEFGSRAAVLTG